MQTSMLPFSGIVSDQRVKFAGCRTASPFTSSSVRGGQNPGRRQARASNHIVHVPQVIRQLGCHGSLIVRQS